jgi:pimeloyl-ACP methyl ester carboxylesterase
MKKVGRFLLLLFLLLLLTLLVGPFLVPVPPLEDTLPPERLADPDSRFAKVDGLQVHYKMEGQGDPAFILLHGFGASVFSWHEVIEPLAGQAMVVAFDRPAFGLTERPMPGEWPGENPYSPEAQVELTVGLMDVLGVEKAILVGNSAGGTVAALAALRYPGRVEALILVDPAIYGDGGHFPGWLRPLLASPQARRLGPLFVRSIREWGEETIRLAWHDPVRITAETYEGYRKPLQAENWDRALWELTLASHSLDLGQRLAGIQIPVLVITGDDDRIVPTEQSIRLAGELPDAELVVIPNCGHVPHEECPEAFLEAVHDFAGSLP